ncbi:MAG: acyl-CoA/acyl-ACP dehydrogenase [Acidobacteriota bacterium]|nr:acyl-CoA/acyl-ACP dehydrogenase [Acidobacteriota bacterium]
MYFGFDEDQIAVKEAVVALLDKRAGLTVLQQAWSDPAAAAAWAVWPDLADMGVQGLLAPESAGGSGLGWVTTALVLSEAGRVALPLPLAETAAIGVPLLASAGDPAGILASVVAGRAVVTVASGTGEPDGGARPRVPAASRADWFVLGDRLYGRDDVVLRPVASVDATRDLAEVEVRGDGLVVGSPLAYGALATAAVLVGLGRALVSTTVEYVKDRHQFGVPVGSFQAVKHQLADAAMHVEFAAPAVWAAAWEMDQRGGDDGGVAPSVSLAKALASDAAERAARTALQCHGAMGYTDDYHLHLWLKRVWCLSPAFGSARWHRRRVGVDMGLYG